jgi:hypothetical protein
VRLSKWRAGLDPGRRPVLARFSRIAVIDHGTVLKEDSFFAFLGQPRNAREWFSEILLAGVCWPVAWRKNSGPNWVLFPLKTLWVNLHASFPSRAAAPLHSAAIPHSARIEGDRVSSTNNDWPAGRPTKHMAYGVAKPV